MRALGPGHQYTKTLGQSDAFSIRGYDGNRIETLPISDARGQLKSCRLISVAWWMLLILWRLEGEEVANRSVRGGLDRSEWVLQNLMSDFR